MIFRKSVRESYRRIRMAIARINAYLQEHVSGMVVLQLFNREKRAYKQFAKINCASHGGVQRRHHGLRRLLSGGGSAVRHSPSRCVVWFGGLACIARWRSHDSACDRVHSVCATILPSHPGPERKIQHPAIGHGIQRTRVQAAGYAREVLSPANPVRAEGKGRDRVRSCLVRLSQAGPEEAAEKVVPLPASSNGHTPELVESAM